MSLRGYVAKTRRDVEEAAAPKPTFWKSMGDLMRLLLRSEAPGLRWRLAAALALTGAGKVLGVFAPLMLASAVNRLSKGQGIETTVALTFGALAAGWALVRFLSAAAPNMRDAIFQGVSLAAQRRAAYEAFAHALSLSLDFHQTKRTGTLSRTIDRGSRAMDFLLRFLVFNLAPTGLELLLAAGVLWGKYDWRFALAAILTIGLYGVFTFAISDWRIRHRREQNEADNEAAGRAVDALLNYETVKSFGAEARAAADYDRALRTYTTASVKASTSLAMLNIVQAAVMSLGLGAMAVLAGLQVMAGRMGPGDVAAVVLIMMSLYQPLNILGFAYREIRQSLIDMESMLELRRQTADVADAADAHDLPPCADQRGGVLPPDAGRDR